MRYIGQERFSDSIKQKEDSIEKDKITYAIGWHLSSANTGSATLHGSLCCTSTSSYPYPNPYAHSNTITTR